MARTRIKLISGYEDNIEDLHDNDIYSAGHTVSTRERLWAVGLQMILEKYNNANN